MSEYSALSDDELRNLLPKDYDHAKDEGVNRPMLRMRWINCLRNKDKADSCGCVIQVWEGRKWAFWAGADRLSVARRCKEILEASGNKARIETRIEMR